MPVIGVVDKAHFKIQTKMKLLGILFLLCVLTMPVLAQDLQWKIEVLCRFSLKTTGVLP